METIASTKRLSAKQSEGRVTNAIADLLRRTLTVPAIYLKPRSGGLSALDVMAVDFAGSGDVHGVEIHVSTILPTKTAIRTMLAPLAGMPVHFRYLAFPSFLPDVTWLRGLSQYEELFDKNGLGRFGIIAFDARLLQRDSSVSADSAVLVVRPERFLVRGEKLATLDKYLARSRPDIEVRL